MGTDCRIKLVEETDAQMVAEDPYMLLLDNEKESHRLPKYKTKDFMYYKISILMCCLNKIYIVQNFKITIEMSIGSMLSTL